MYVCPDKKFSHIFLIFLKTSGGGGGAEVLQPLWWINADKRKPN